ncbi:Fur family transcriptional regulator [Hathewaya histolytica]|uniref:Ferric uptake regulator n=1 Tax=Hathewaya histolytica TaxID=1498 RepID=A0A4U9R798_HATHI|nr:Fur family transcriptional regulator [Hathewaya histolytica]VTQ85973.1 ferric uptake regulator [Hathewaya histolytica]
MNNITAIFKERNLKLTPQRIAVYKYLQSTKGHPSAEIIYKALQEDYPTMSLATVYKALKTLVEVNLVRELNVGEGNFRYDACTDEHPHIQCLHCGRVDDIEGISFLNLNEEIAPYTDYNVVSNKLYFYGVCKECSEKDSEQKDS